VGISEIPEPRAQHPDAEREVERLRLRRSVQAALERLPKKQREALVLVDLEERTAVEASEMLNVPVGTIYSRLHHARRAFAKALAAQGVSMDRGKGRGVVRLVEPKR
jgi:RNA polymerase sigma-70 factor (ECF subfamily)